jgi:hypothetical protein
MNEAEQLFRDTMSDLRSRIASGSDYDLRRTSALLRQLLVDEITLLSLANQTQRIKVRFRVGTLSRLVSKPNSVVIRGFAANSGTPVDATIDQFLACDCLVAGNRAFTVRHIIKVNANIRGGVHVANKLDEDEQALLSVLAEQIKCGFGSGTEVDPLLFLLVEISHTVLEALLPLQSAIESSIASSK